MARRPDFSQVLVQLGDGLLLSLKLLTCFETRELRFQHRQPCVEADVICLLTLCAPLLDGVPHPCIEGTCKAVLVGLL